MGQNVNNLTEILCDGTFDTEVKAGRVALENQAYEQAWNHFYKLYTSNQITKTQKGEASYYLYEVMKKTPVHDPLIGKLLRSDPGLIKKAQMETVSFDYARRYIGRKYLEDSAQYEYSQGMIEYGLSCVDCADEGGFPYKFNEYNGTTGVEWAQKMLEIEKRKGPGKADRKVKAAAYIILSKYYYVQRANECKTGTSITIENSIVRDFCENAFNAQAQGIKDEYICYFMAQVYSNPLFKCYEGGKHYNLAEAKELFEWVEENAHDPKLKESAKDFKNLTIKQMNLTKR